MKPFSAVFPFHTPESVFGSVGELAYRFGWHTWYLQLQPDGQSVQVSHLTPQSQHLRAVEALTHLSADDYTFQLAPDSIFARVIREKNIQFFELRVCHFSDALPPQFRHLSEEILNLLGWCNLILTPAWVDDQVVGLWAIVGRELSQADIPAVSTLVNFATTALENIRLYERVQNYAADLEKTVRTRTDELFERVLMVEKLNLAMTNLMADLQAKSKDLEWTRDELSEANLRLQTERVYEQAVLLQLSQGLLDRHDLTAIMKFVLRETISALSCEYAAIILVDENRVTFSVRASMGFPNKLQSIPSSPRPVASDLIAAAVIREKRPIQISNIADETAYTFPSVASGLEINAALVVPLIFGDDAIGCVVLHTVESRQWTEDEIQLAMLIANSAASAIVNAQLFDQVSATQQRLQKLSGQLVLAQENERRRLARELHDQIGQALSAIKVNLNTLVVLPPGADIQPIIQRCLTATDQAIKEVRDLSLDLRPSVLDDLGLVAAIRWFLYQHFDHSGLDFSVVEPELNSRLPEHVETVCYRVLQEACTNILKHAAATRVKIEMACETHDFVLLIEDNGVGFDLAAAMESARHGISLGLVNMQERVDLAGGVLTYDTRPGHGTRLEIRFRGILSLVTI